MQPDDKELLIKLKTRTANQPQSINLASYKLRKAYKRLNDYINACIAEPDKHNLYELLAISRFFCFLDK
jgi:hypothetical protein